MTVDLFEHYRSMLDAMRQEHNSILARVDSASARIVSVEVAAAQLRALGPRQQKHLREAIGCIEQGYFRAAIVTAWAAVADRVIEMLEADHFVRLRAARPKWMIASRDDLTESYTEHALIEALGDAQFIAKSLRKTLLGQLHTRNQAAHPTSFDPTFNGALGFVDSVTESLAQLENPK